MIRNVSRAGHHRKYEKRLLKDFKTEMSDPRAESFFSEHDLHNLVDGRENIFPQPYLYRPFINK